MKNCRVCNNLLPEMSFRKNIHYKGGHVCICLSCEKKYKAEYYSKNRERILAKINNLYFGHSVKDILDNFGNKCCDCGVTNVEHILNTGKRLSIHHVDGNGKNKSSQEKNNSMSNLKTMCMSCHLKEDRLRILLGDDDYKRRYEEVGGPVYSNRKKEYNKWYAMTHREQIRANARKRKESRREF